MEVRSPAILPGGARTNALASIAETSGVSGAGMVGAVFRFAAMFWPGPRLFRVRSWVESAQPTRITVLLEDVKTGLPIATKTVAGDNFNEAASMVAGYIARQIFAMDRTFPSGVTASQTDGTSARCSLSAWNAPMRRATEKSPSPGNSRSTSSQVRRGQSGPRESSATSWPSSWPCEGQHLESLRLHALNREMHPRFYRGRYRLAMSLEMIASLEHYLPYDNATLHNLAETLEILSRDEHADRKLKVVPRTRGRRKLETASPHRPARNSLGMRVPRTSPSGS